MTLLSKILIIIPLLIALMLFTGCGRHTEAWHEMDIAEKVMETMPDSALKILDNLDRRAFRGRKKPQDIRCSCRWLSTRTLSTPRLSTCFSLQSTIIPKMGIPTKSSAHTTIKAGSTRTGKKRIPP